MRRESLPYTVDEAHEDIARFDAAAALHGLDASNEHRSHADYEAQAELMEAEGDYVPVQARHKPMTEYPRIAEILRSYGAEGNPRAQELLETLANLCLGEHGGDMLYGHFHNAFSGYANKVSDYAAAGEACKRDLIRQAGSLKGDHADEIAAAYLAAAELVEILGPTGVHTVMRYFERLWEGAARP